MMSTSTAGLLASLKSSKATALMLFAAISILSLLVIGRTNSSSGPAEKISVAAPLPPSLPTTSKFTQDQELAIGEIVKSYLLRNPQVLMEAGQALEQQQRDIQAAQAKTIIKQQKDLLFRSNHDFVYGNPKGDVTIVEYFDYNCGWCKKAVDEIMKLAAQDPKVRIVLKEFPVFGGPPSVEAAKAAMASIKQGKYWNFHVSLMRERQVGPENIYTIAKNVGIDVAKLKTDMADPKLEAILQQNVQIARQMGMEATPGFLVDTRLNVGFIRLDEMMGMLSEIRRAGCEAC